MALERDPPYVGDIGEPDGGYCENPLHDEDCTCGADPDGEYETEMERRAEDD